MDNLNIQYKKIYDAYPWDDIKLFNVETTTTDGVIRLPNNVDQVRAVRIDKSVLYPKGEIHTFNFNPDAYDTAGTPYGYIHKPDSPLLVDSTTTEALDIVSTSTSDNTASSLTVRVEGESGGELISSEVDLNGTTDVPTSSFTLGTITSITKPLTTGSVKVKAQDGTVLATLLPHQYKSAYKTIQLSPIVNSSTTVKLMCLRKFERLVSDNDSILIDRAESAIIELTKAKIYDYLEMDVKAQTARTLAADDLRVALLNETRVNDKEMRVLPATGGFSFNNFGESGFFGH